MKKFLFILFIFTGSFFFSRFFNWNLSAQVNLNTSLTACYAFNNSGSEPINNLTATISAVTPTVDRFNNPNSAYSFSGSTLSYIQLPKSPLLKPTNAVSFSGWYKPSAITGWMDLVFTKNIYSAYFTAYSLNIQNNGAGYKFRTYRQNGNGENYVDGTTTPIAGTWYHVVVTADNSSMKIYVNGSLEGTVALTIPNFNYDTSRYVVLGGTNELAANNPFKGSIDNIRFYNRILNAQEVSSLYTLDPSCLNLPPIASFFLSATQICAGGAITFSDMSTNSPTAWNWVIPGVATSTVSNPTIIFPTTGTFVVSLVSSNSSGSSNTATMSIFVKPNPNVSCSATNTMICPGQNASLTANGAINYTWSPGNINGSIVVVNPASSVVYTVTGIDTTGCAGSATLGVTVGSSPTITALANPTAICSGISSTLSAIGAISYSWFPGNLTGSVVTVSPGSTTIYTVIGSNGTCTNSANVTLTNTLNPTISSSGNLCNNNSVNLFVSPGTATNIILWSGPGIAGTNNTNMITVNTGGIYSVVVTDTVTNCSGTATISVTSSLSPLALNVIPSSTLACFPGPPVNILVSTSANFNWFPPLEVVPNTGPLVSVNPSVTSTYTVIGTLGACSGSSAITISITPTPTLVTSAGNLTLCSGTSTTLSATGANAYNWLPGNHAGTSITVIPVSNVIYTVTGANGNCTASNNITVTVLSIPNFTPAASPTLICSGNSSSLSAGNAGSFTWQPGGSLSSSFVVSPTVTTIYSVSVENSLGCISQSFVPLYVYPSFIISANSSGSLICNGSSVSLTASGAQNYTWLPGNQTGSVFVNFPTTSTTYTVRADNLGCSHASLFVQVVNCNSTVFGLTNAADKPVLFNSNFYKINFTVTIINNSKESLFKVILNDALNNTFIYPCTFKVVNPPTVISKNSGLVANPFFDGASEISLTNPLTSILFPGKRDTIVFSVLTEPNGFYGQLKNSVIGFADPSDSLTVTDISNDGFSWDPDNDGDPTNNNAITLIDIPLIDLFIPGGFSPNEDGINDLFVIRGLNGRSLKLTVFNRWGNKVYEKDHYDNSWDGKANAGGVIIGTNKLQQATYYYIIQFEDGSKEEKRGFVVLQY